MVATAPELDLELPALRREVPKARKAAREFAIETGADPDIVAVAVSEAVSNAVLHAYPGGASGTFLLTGYASADSIELTVSDRGSGMKPNPDGPGHGLGLSIIAAVAMSVRIESQGGVVGTAVTMKFNRHG